MKLIKFFVISFLTLLFSFSSLHSKHYLSINTYFADEKNDTYEPSAKELINVGDCDTFKSF